MPTDYGRFMGSMADAVQGPVNAFYQAQERQRVLGQRDESLRQDADQNAFMRQRYTEQQSQNQITAQQQQEIMGKWAELKQIEKAPPDRQVAWLQEQAATPGFNETVFAGLTPEQAIPMMKAKISALLGIEDEQPQAASLPGEIQRYEYGLTRPGFREYEDRNRPQASGGGGGVSGGGYRLMTADEVTKAGYPEGSVVEVGPKGNQSVKFRPPSASTVTEGPDGEMIVTPGKSSDAMKTASGFATRMVAAEKKLGDYRPSTKDYMAASSVMAGGPMVASAANNVLSAEGQRYYQAAADWVRAKLRKESGAVISPEEMAQEIKTYFPLPGDDDSVIAQKKQARAQAMESLKTQAGGVVTQEAGAKPAAKPSPSNHPADIQRLLDKYGK